MSGVFAELKRRHVWRVAIAYGITIWLLLQLASIVLPSFGAPAWVMRALIAIFVICFPLAILLAWAFELTPEGVRRTEPAHSPGARETRDTHAVGRQLDIVIIVVLVIAVALLGWRVLALRHAPTPGLSQSAATGAGDPDAASRKPHAGIADSATVGATSWRRNGRAQGTPIPTKSIAVLPFVNGSGDQAQQYFSDGLSEDLITALSQFRGLKVIGRHSAFQFRHSKDTSAEIGRKLGVAHLLEGSVRRVGDTVRINATLVNAADGSTLWSRHYDRPYKDLFALQDDITRSVAAALEARLLGGGGAVVQSNRPPSGNLDAWNAYSRGRFHVELFNPVDARKAIVFYEQAIALDPGYARAYADLSIAGTNLAATYLSSEKEQRAAYAKARTAAERALQLDADVAMAHAAQAMLLLWVDFDFGGAQAELRRALELAPNDGYLKFRLSFLLRTLGRPRPAIAALRQSIATDPRNSSAWYWLGWNQAAIGQLPEAEQSMRKAIALQPASSFLPTGLSIIQIRRGRAEAALDAAQREPPGLWRDVGLALALQVGDDRVAADAALQHLITASADAVAYQIAEVYALRREPDAMFQWLDRAWGSRDPGILRLLTDPFILRYRHDPRFAALCHKIGLPTTIEAAAMK